MSGSRSSTRASAAFTDATSWGVVGRRCSADRGRSAGEGQQGRASAT